MTSEDERHSLRGRGPFMVGPWRVEPETCLLHQGDLEVRLEPRVMDLLVCLAARPGEVMSRDELEASVWAGMIVGYDSLSSAIIKLRKAFGDDSRNPAYIATVSKRGYRLIASVVPVSTEAPPPVPAPATPLMPGSLPVRALLAGFVTVLLLALAGLWMFADRDPQPSSLPSASPANMKRISLVVLPFTNANINTEQEYFSDGITDDLISDLSRYSALDVVARRTAYVYKHRQSDIQTIARDLGVHYVLDGDVRRDGDKVRLNVQLVDVGTGMNIWAQRFDRQVEDIFAVQDDLRASILRALSVTLTSEERQRHGRRDTSSFAAYDLFLQGQAALVTRASAEDSQRAQRFMEQAIQLDPGYARAYAALALIHADAFRFGWAEDPETTRQTALKTGQRAVELDAASHQALWILGYIYLFLFEDHKQAATMATQATELAPTDLDAATVLAVTHAFGDAPQQAKGVVTGIIAGNKRYSSMVPSVLGLANLRLGNYQEALAAYDQSLLINPSRVQGNVYRTVALYRMGNVDEAEFQVSQLYSLHPDFDLKLWAERQPFQDKTIVRQLMADLIAAGVTPQH